MWYIFNLGNIKQNTKEELVFILYSDISTVVRSMTIEFMSVKHTYQGLKQGLHERTDYCVVRVQYIHHWCWYCFIKRSVYLLPTGTKWHTLTRKFFTLRLKIFLPIFSTTTHIWLHISDALKAIGIHMILNKLPEGIIKRMNVRRPWWPRPFYSRLSRITVRNHSNTERSVWNIKNSTSSVQQCSQHVKKRVSLRSQPIPRKNGIKIHSENASVRSDLT
jgi:hypothetical protein